MVNTFYTDYESDEETDDFTDDYADILEKQAGSQQIASVNVDIYNETAKPVSLHLNSPGHQDQWTTLSPL